MNEINFALVKLIYFCCGTEMIVREMGSLAQLIQMGRLDQYLMSEPAFFFQPSKAEAKAEHKKLMVAIRLDIQRRPYQRRMEAVLADIRHPARQYFRRHVKPELENRPGTGHHYLAAQSRWRACHQ
jgi:hypothetical protein